MIIFTCFKMYSKEIENELQYKFCLDHPRILLTIQEEKKLLSQYKANSAVRVITDKILSDADSLINTKPLIRKFEGKRMLNTSRDALKRIFYLSYAYRYTKDSRYATRAIAEMINVSNFEDWNPSHFLDVAEMTMGVAVGYDWLYDCLTRQQRETIINAIRCKSFEPALENKYSWFRNIDSNWNSVCNSALIYGAIAFQDVLPDLSIELIDKGILSNRKVLLSYEPDGGTPEGYGYWSYGTLYEVLLFDVLTRTYGHDFGLSSTKGFFKTPEYIQFMSAPSGLCFNFSDTSNKVKGEMALWWFANINNNMSLLYKELQRIENKNCSYSEDWLLPLLPVFASRLKKIKSVKPTIDTWYSSGKTPVYIYRSGWNDSSDCYLGIKGGSASTSHAHMDAGSFIYEHGGVRWAEDLGGGDYTILEKNGYDLWNMSQYSSRWNIPRMNNKYHNTLTIDEQEQNVDGYAYFDTIYSNDRYGGIVNLTSVLPHIKYAAREFIIDKKNQLIIMDRIIPDSSNHTLTWTLITKANARLENDSTIVLSLGDKKLEMKVRSKLSFSPFIKKIEWSDVYGSVKEGYNKIGFISTLMENKYNEYTVELVSY